MTKANMKSKHASKDNEHSQGVCMCLCPFAQMPAVARGIQPLIGNHHQHQHNVARIVAVARIGCCTHVGWRPLGSASALLLFLPSTNPPMRCRCWLGALQLTGSEPCSLQKAIVVHCEGSCLPVYICKPVCSFDRCPCSLTWFVVVTQVAEAERSLQLLKSQLLLAEAKQQSLRLQIKYAQVRTPA